MSNENAYPVIPQHNPTIHTPKKKRNWPLIVVSTVAALFFVLFLVAANGLGQAAEREEVYDSCIQAIDLADKGFAITADSMDAITRLDVRDLEENTEDLRAITNDYLDAKEQCRSLKE